ncbi:hypothetical protein AB0A81_32115 [Streptomyces flaveolus]|uniref:MmyB family transcriptional regulator n=1 Tax=Streptomyces flaveolus TaxID=67297 RepID=UPI0033D2E4E7
MSPVLRHVLAALTDIPAIAMGNDMTLLEGNRPAAVLLGDFASMATVERNFARLTFLDDRWRSF